MSKYQVSVSEYADDKLPEANTYVPPQRTLVTALVDDIETVQSLVMALQPPAETRTGVGDHPCTTSRTSERPLE